MHKQKIAIVIDWLIDFGWAELVISHLLEVYPEADIYTSVCYMNHPMLKGRNIYTSWLQKIPFLNRKHKLAGILRPWAFRSFDLSGYDVVICSSSAESKQVAMGKWRQSPPSEKGEPEGVSQKGISQSVTHPNPPLSGREWNQTKVIVYCHTPTRYYWSHAKEYEDMMEFGIFNPLVKSVFRLVKWWMQKVDYEAAQKVDYFIANSKTTAERIRKYYDRDADVIYPGIDESQFQISDVKGDFYFGMGRCIPYKKFDLLVDTFNANGKKLILATNTDNLLYRELREKSGANIEWRFAPSITERNTLYAWSKAFLFPPEEDFGLVPVEAMMSGTPVIAYGKWGGTESVIDGETGIFFTLQTPEALNTAIEKFETMKWDREKIRKRGMEFSKEKFQENIHNFVKRHAN